ncbi:oligosaccharide flippase family protein [Vibrio sp. TH_r3]|uniref:oligosaccharide flippase family protein n=1 Tax=Vibrio sp. TH_r3 TaxID=3082084 RepID=UPI0029557DFF|nr:oligosaccharide flippase family protein [Vibrio sp. TH_r3]MDV7102911.1 oligosaccharide flippase family protein [Vibrio sp. TH_r3]
MSAKLEKKMAIGYIWNLLSKWVNRSIGVISSIILIRLLEPEDFGIAALASIVIALFVMFSDSGAEKYAIKAEDCNDELLNSAWSLNILLKLCCAMLIAAFSHLIAELTYEPVLKNVLLLCSFLPIISGFKNIGLVHYERELNYKPLARLSVITKLIVFPVTIGLALWWQNYWALILGSIISELMLVIGSYWIHPYRPKWSSKLWRTQWSFSQWVMISTATGYIRSRLDVLLIGRFLPSESVGVYRVSQEFAWLPFSELISPATASFYAGITKISHNRDELNDKLLRYLTVTYILVVPSAFGIYALQDQIVAVVMGERWISAAPIMGLLSLLMLSMPLNVALQTVLISLNKVKYLVVIDIVMIAAILFSFMTLNQVSFTEQSRLYGVEGYTLVRVGLVGLFIPLLFLVYKTVLNINCMRAFCACFIPVIPSLFMLFVIEHFESVLAFSEWINLCILIVCGVVVFLPSMIVVIFATRNILSESDYLYKVMCNSVLKIRKKFRA